jgi:hypothetical protein
MNGLRLGIAFLIGQILIIFSAWRYLPPQIPLFYSRPWGEEQLVNPLGIFILPGLSLGFLLINLVITMTISREEILIRQLLMGASAIVNLFCLITLIQIVRLVI